MVFGSVVPPQGDVVDCLVHLGCSKEVSSYSIRLQNWDGKYSPSGATPITVGMDGGISMGRGANCPQLITCRVESIDFESSPTERYVTVSGRCWGERLFRRVVTKTYSSQKGEAIVKDLLDYYAGLSHVRDSLELVESTDTTYAQLEYADSPLWDILKYVAETADKSGVIGFDFRVAPDGKFEFFRKNSKTNPVSLTEKIESSRYRKDISRIRNKITIYGLADKSVPADKLAWTRSLTPSDGAWQAASGSISVDATGAPDGGACIAVDSSGVESGSANFLLNSGHYVNGELYPILATQFKLDSSFSGTGVLLLYDAALKVASKNVTVSPDGEWHAVETGVGVAYANQWNYVEAGFDWTQIRVLRSAFYLQDSPYSGVYRIHGLFFGGRRYAAQVEDGASQAAYGLREYVETDEELWSDNECDLRAEALLNYLKSPAEYLTLTSTVIDFGTTPFLAGDKVHVTLPNENVDSDFRIESVEYHFAAEEQTLEVSLELGKEPPQLADYLYGLRTFTVNVEKLSRTKIGKRGIPVATQGAGGSGNSHFTSNVDIDKTSPVLNLQVSRANKAAFGFDGVNAWLVTYAGDLVLRTQTRVFRPYSATLPDDLGSESFPWGNAYISALCKVGWLNIGSFTVLTSGRVLQNVTADAAVIVSGQFPIARMPQDLAGLVLESQGVGFWPMYVDPNGRYQPAPHLHDYAPVVHTHAAVDVNSGVLAEARVPNVYTGAVTFQGGIVTNSVNCTNWHLADAIFANNFRMTESEKLGYCKGVAFLNDKGKVLMVLSKSGSLWVAGKVKSGLLKTRKTKRKQA